MILKNYSIKIHTWIHNEIGQLVKRERNHSETEGRWIEESSDPAIGKKQPHVGECAKSLL